MPAVIQYLCQPELLPVVEGALAAHGYSIDIPRRPSADRATMLVMSYGLTSILLADTSSQALATIEIWGLGQSLAAQLLESLPLALHKPVANHFGA